MPDNQDLNKDLNNPKYVAQEIYKRNLELHQERKRAAQLLHKVSEAIYATDRHCKITLINHTLETLLQTKARTLLGKDVVDVIKLEKENGSKIDITQYCNIKDTRNVRVPAVAVLKGVEQDYYVHVKISIIEAEDPDKIEYLVTMSDVTKEKRLEQAKDEFISITSHELRTPISIVKSYLWMVQEGKGGPLNPKQARYIDIAAKGADRMVNLINDILNISRMEQGNIEFKCEKVTAKEFLSEVVEELRVKTVEKKLTLKLDIQNSPKQLYTDKQKLREILTNLIGNAVKYTPKGGIKVVVTEEQNDFAKIAIIDTGRGIAKEEVPLLFHKFQRLESSYQKVAESGGTGLGLYIVKLYVSKLGGSVGVESNGIGKGSTFWVTIPTRRKT